MSRFIIFLIIFTASVFIGMKIAQDPGFALFSYQNYTIEMPLWFAALSLLLILLVNYLFMRIFDGIDFSLYRWNNWLRWRRKYKSYSKTNRGLIELIEGNWGPAEHYLLDGIQQSDAPLINYLAAAKAAQEQGAFDKRDSYLRKAHDIAPHAEIAIGLTQAQLQLDQGQLEQALATLDHLRHIAPKHQFVLKLLEKLYIRLGDWEALLKLLPSLRKAKLINAENAENFELHLYQELLNGVQNKNDNVEALRKAWRNVPRKLQANPVLINLYAKKLLPYPESARELESLLSKAIKKSSDPELVRLYGLLITPEPLDQLMKAEGWQKLYPNQATLLLTLGRLSVYAQLWGKARNYFETSLRLEANPEVYAEYGKLLELLGEQAAAADSYRNGLLLAAAR